jgi:hypothetical protein
MKFMKILLSLIFLVISAPSFATNASFTKTATPGVIIITNGGTGLATFFASSTDFPSGALTKPKTLLGIDYTTTLYPNNQPENVKLCYYRPYTGTYVGCVVILPNSSGTITTFNNQLFDVGTEVVIFHSLVGGPQPASPAGKDTVTFRYSY